jgi:tRNA threonylcarbamoyladenosine biosynthesis protein TsaB
MMVLAVESATELAGVALADEAGVLATATVSRGRHHAESMAPAIEFVCGRTGVRLADVDAVAVDVGPGLFTGLRVGVGTAKALVFALHVPLVGVPSLEILAHAVATSGVPDGTLVIPVVDARRGEVFAGRLRAGQGAVSWEGDAVRRSPEALAGELARLGEPLVVAGNGARRYRSVFEAVPGAVMAGEALDFPPPGVLATLAVARVSAGLVDDGAGVLPHYLRDAETRIKWETRARPAGAGA